MLLLFCEAKRFELSQARASRFRVAVGLTAACSSLPSRLASVHGVRRGDMGDVEKAGDATVSALAHRGHWDGTGTLLRFRPAIPQASLEEL